MDGDAKKVDKPIPENYQQVRCPRIGPIDCFIQGTRCSNEVVILTVHDIGCDHTMYYDFLSCSHMTGIRSKTVWLHLDIPGQGQGASDLAADFSFPTMQEIGEDLVHVLDALNIREVVCFGEGAGANILARFALGHQERVLGVVLIHCTGTTAGFLEAIKDKMINHKLLHVGMNPSAESYLILHRFGSLAMSKSSSDELKHAVENYQTFLRTKTNPKNLRLFVESFMKRTSISDAIKKLKCPTLFVTGSNSIFRTTTQNLHHHLMKAAKDRNIIDLLEVHEVASVLEEKPEKLSECLLYFLQGLGLVSSLPMLHSKRTQWGRSASMEVYDLPQQQRNRTLSGGIVASVPMQHMRPEPQFRRNRSLSMEEYDNPKLARLRSTSMSGGDGDGSGSCSPNRTSPIAEATK